VRDSLLTKSVTGGVDSKENDFPFQREYCILDRLLSTRGVGNVSRQILRRSSTGSFEKRLNASIAVEVTGPEDVASSLGVGLLSALGFE
jgi:hypothetical protein